MKLLDFNKMDGFPASASTFKFIQEQMLQLQMLSLIGGTNYIVSGCANVGGVVGNGWIVINGEVLPFVGGAVQANVVIVDTPTNRSFHDTTLNPYYHDRVAQFGTGATEYAWSSFEINNPANGLLTRMRLAEALLATLQTQLATSNTAIGTKANITDVLVKGNTTPFTPALQYDPATKGYVDNASLILAKGTITVGDIAGGQTTVTASFGITLPSTNYLVFATIVADDITKDNATLTWCVKNKTVTSFEITLREVYATLQSVNIHWFIIPS